MGIAQHVQTLTPRTLILLTTAMVAGSFGCGSEPSEVSEGSEQASPSAELDQPHDLGPPGASARDSSPYALALAELDEKLAVFESQAAEHPDDWTRLERAATTRMERGRLTGDLGDYVRAEDMLDSAFSVAVKGSGPWMSRAALNMSLHRLDRVEADLHGAAGRLLLSDPQRAAQQLVAANLAFQRGEYTKALEGIEAALKLDKTVGGYSALALYHWKTGEFDRAEALYAEAEALYHNPWPEPKAWFDLQRGLMDLDRGRYEDALAHYRDAEQDLGGYWLIEEHIAEVLGLLGRQSESETLYRDLIERTGSPELTGALGGLLLELGRQSEAKQLIAQADAGFAEDMALFPEAAAGHTLRHALEHGADPAATLALAERNAAIRPNGEALTLLAQALLQAERVPEALSVIEAVLQSPWRSAETFATAASIYSASGLNARAEETRELALSINPFEI